MKKRVQTKDKISTCTMLPLIYQYQAEPFGNDCSTRVNSFAIGNRHRINGEMEPVRRLLQDGTIGFDPNGV